MICFCEDGVRGGRNGLEQYCENGRISKRLTGAEIGKLLTNRFQSRANLEFKMETKVNMKQKHENTNIYSIFDSNRKNRLKEVILVCVLYFMV